MPNLTYLKTLSTQIIHEMWGHKLRSILALFCIIWGALTIILLLALGDGFRTVSEKNILNVTDGAFIFIPSETSKAFRGFPKGQSLYIKSDAIMDVAKYVPHVKAVSPMLVIRTNISANHKQIRRRVYGVSADFLSIRKLNLEAGSRFFNLKEANSASRVAILGYKVRKTLFEDLGALNQRILINNIPFTVIGLIQNPVTNIHNSYDNSIIIPYETYITMYGDVNAPFFVIVGDPQIDETQMMSMLRSYFAYKYHFDSTDTLAIKIFSSTQMLQFFMWFFIGIKIFLGLCGALMLGVGSLGVTNIMFLIVTERTKEIGLRKAVGATDWNILLQIMLEALIIVGLGGLIGFCIADVTVFTLQNITLPAWLGRPVLSLGSAIIVISVLAIMGLLAGYFPARRAAQLDPVVALSNK